MNAALINAIGLIFDVVGAVMIWRYTLPNRKPEAWGTGRRTADPPDPKLLRKDERWRTWSGLGITFLVWGFALQALSGWL